MRKGRIRTSGSTHYMFEKIFGAAKE